MMISSTKVQCGDCERIFDLMIEDEANDWYSGHDCENN
jgi:hypothetical protein